MRTLGIMLLLIVALQGCGHKGPLHMPSAEPQNTPGQSGQKDRQ